MMMMMMMIIFCAIATHVYYRFLLLATGRIDNGELCRIEITAWQSESGGCYVW